MYILCGGASKGEFFERESCYRTVLTPVSFLRRSAYVFPDKIAVVHGARRYTYRQLEERATGWPRAARRRAARSTTGSPSCARTPRRCSRRTSACPPRGSCWSRSTPGSHGRDRLHPRALGRGSSSSTPSSRRCSPTSTASGSCASTTPALPAIPTRTSSPPARPSRRELARGRGRDDLDQLHLGHDRAAQGRDVHSPRRLAQRASARRSRPGMTFDTSYLWTLPMFHCNGWCFTWGGHRGRRAPTSACGASSRPDLGPDRLRGRHPLLRRAHRADRHRQRPEGARGSTRPVTVTVAGAPPSPDPARQAPGARTSAPSTSTASPRPTARTPCARGTRSGTRCPPRSGRGSRPARARATSLADLVRVVDESMHDVPRDGETLGEVVMRGNNVMKGYFEQPEATAEAFRGGWFHSGDIGGLAPRRLHRAARPEEGHHHLGRREHLDHRGGAGRAAPSGRAGVRGRRHPRREVGRAPQGVRRRSSPAQRPPKPRSSSSAGSTSPTSSARPRSSSATCPRPRPARSRSSSCATRSGPTGRTNRVNR